MKPREINATDPLHHVVGVPDEPAGRPAVRDRGCSAEGHRPGHTRRRPGDPWLVRRRRAARRRRPDGLVARPKLGHAAGRLPRVAPLRSRTHDLAPVWSQMALHRPAEFNKGHVPAFMPDEEPKAYLCVYPFVRSYEWYLLPEEERRAMLTEHGMLARPYPDVRANTVSSFALGDYEWMLAFEADDLHRIVDLMRALRAAAARRHTREEIPFYTGRRRELSGHPGPLVTEAVRNAAGSGRSLRGRAQAELDSVDAIPQVSRGVVALAGEHVAQMRVTLRAAHLDALHEQRSVLDVAHPVFGQRREEGRPAAV